MLRGVYTLEESVWKARNRVIRINLHNVHSIVGEWPLGP